MEWIATQENTHYYPPYTLLVAFPISNQTLETDILPRLILIICQHISNCTSILNYPNQEYTGGNRVFYPTKNWLENSFYWIKRAFLCNQISTDIPEVLLQEICSFL